MNNKKIIYALLVVLIVFVATRAEQKQSVLKKTGIDPTETVWGSVTDNGVLVQNAQVRITIHSSAATGTMEDTVYDGLTNTLAGDGSGRYLYLIQVQWRGYDDADDEDPITVEAWGNGKYGSVSTVTGMTPFQIDVPLTSTAPPLANVIFRQSVTTWDSYIANGAWVAADRNADGALEGYGYYSKTQGSSYSANCGSNTYELIKTPEGNSVRIKDSYPNRVYACFHSGAYYYEIVFDSTDSDAASAVLSTSRVAGYETRETLTGDLIQCTAGTCCNAITQKYKSSSTVCGTYACSTQSSLCRTYSDVNIKCTGSSADCPISATCNSYVDAAFGTLCTSGKGMCSSGSCLTIAYGTFTTYANSWAAGSVAFPNYIMYGNGWVNTP